MKVLCITSEWVTTVGQPIPDYPEYGKTYTVIQTLQFFGISVFELVEFPPIDDEPNYFRTDSFEILDNTGNGRPIIVVNNKPSHAEMPICPPVIVGIPGT